MLEQAGRVLIGRITAARVKIITSCPIIAAGFNIIASILEPARIRFEIRNYSQNLALGSVNIENDENHSFKNLFNSSLIRYSSMMNLNKVWKQEFPEN